jgi:hypothetical protein
LFDSSRKWQIAPVERGSYVLILFVYADYAKILRVGEVGLRLKAFGFQLFSLDSGGRGSGSARAATPAISIEKVPVKPIGIIDDDLFDPVRLDNGYYKAFNRVLLEVCCGKDSLMSSHTEFSERCICVRLTERHDLTTAIGLRRGCDALNLADFLKLPILVWISIPCTGGSSWQRINKVKGPDTEEKIRKHRELFDKLLLSALRLAISAILSGEGKVVIEWPASCDYWRDPLVRQFISQSWTVVLLDLFLNLGRTRVDLLRKLGSWLKIFLSSALP